MYPTVDGNCLGFSHMNATCVKMTKMTKGFYAFLNHHASMERSFSKKTDTYFSSVCHIWLMSKITVTLKFYNDSNLKVFRLD